MNKKNTNKVGINNKEKLNDRIHKCTCKKATFSRTVDAEFNPLCGKCGKPI